MTPNPKQPSVEQIEVANKIVEVGHVFGSPAIKRDAIAEFIAGRDADILEELRLVSEQRDGLAEKLDARDSVLAAMTKERDQYKDIAAHHKQAASELEAALDALRAPISDQEEREALECAREEGECSGSEWPMCRHGEVIARLLRQRTAALKDSQERLNRRTLERDYYLETISACDIKITEAEKVIAQSCIDQNEQSASQQRLADTLRSRAEAAVAQEAAMLNDLHQAAHDADSMKHSIAELSRKLQLCQDWTVNKQKAHDDEVAARAVQPWREAVK